MIWWTKSWNPVIGCTACSPACDNCYAERLHKQRYIAQRRQRDKGLLAGKTMPPCYSMPFSAVRFLPERQAQPLRWKTPQRIFVCNMGDLFHEDVPFWAIDRIFAAMSLSRQHTYYLLTKRPERMLEYMTRENFRKRIYDAGACNFPFPLPNVWLGTTVWDQASADRAVPILLSTPAAKRFVSVEPMLGPVDLVSAGAIAPPDKPFFEVGTALCTDPLCGRSETHYPREFGCRWGLEPKGLPGLDWVICGGETGPGARSMHPAWARSLRDQCVAAGGPFFFKQWGEWAPPAPGSDLEYEAAMARGAKDLHVFPDAGFTERLGSRRAGRELDGRTWEEVPNV